LYFETQVTRLLPVRTALGFKQAISTDVPDFIGNCTDDAGLLSHSLCSPVQAEVFLATLDKSNCCQI
jgi:hypothetical protein